MANKRILHVLGGLGRGGAETWFVQVLPHLTESGYEVDALVFNHSREAYTDRVTNAGGRVVRIDSPSSLPSFFRNLKDAIRRHGPYDVVHSHVWLASGLVMYAAAINGVPCRIAHSRNTRDKHSPNLGRLAYSQLMRLLLRRYSTHTIGITDAAGRGLFGSASWRASGKVIPTSIDLEPFEQGVDPLAVRSELGISPDSFVVGHVGSFTEQKNHALLVEIFVALKEEKPDAVLLLLGDGYLLDTVKKAVRTTEHNKDVIFAGLRDDVPRIMMGAMDVFVFPSRWEGLGRVVVEAQAAGVPCVMSDVVPSEADLVRGLVRRVPLDSGANKWVTEIVDVTSRSGTHDDPKALDTVRASSMNVTVAARLLDQLYRKHAIDTNYK